MDSGVQNGTHEAASPNVSPASATKSKKKLWSVSPSQVDAYRRCPRVWYNASVLKDREPSKPFQLRGEAIHKALEIFLKSGEVHPTLSLPDPLKSGEPTEFKTLEYVQVALPYIPRPVTDAAYWQQFPRDEKNAPTAMLLLEQPGELVTFDQGPSVSQFIDVVEALPSTCRIIDYKTTSNFRYAKTPEELRENTQLCWNAKFVFAISDYEEIEIQHLYLLTTGRPKAMVVKTKVTRDDVEKVWQRDMALVREMMAWAELGASTAESLPPHTESCDMYGGCYYRQKPECGFDVSTVGFRKASPTMSTPEKTGLLKELLDKAKKVNPNSAVVQETDAALKEGKGVGGLMAKLNGRAAPPAAPPGVTVYEAPQKPQTEAPYSGAMKTAADSLKEKLASKRAEVPATTTGIVPPDAPPATSTPEEVEEANKAVAAKEAEAEEDKTDEAPEEKDAAPAAETPKRRGRKPKTAVETPEPSMSVEEAAAALKAQQPEPVATDPSADVINNAEQLHLILTSPDSSYDCGCEVLFVDCFPAKGWKDEVPVDLATMMHAFEKVAAQSAKKADYRLISYEAKGYLAMSIRALMKGLPKSVYLDSRSPGADVFLSVVTPYCKYIFRGTR